MAKASENVFPKVQFSEEAAPATPSTGEAVVYVKSDGKIYLKDDAGTETDLTASGGGGGTFSGARVFNSTNQTNLASGTDLTFDSERFDTDTFHDTGTNTERLTVPSAGKYMVGASFECSGGASGYRGAILRVNGTTNVAINTAPSSGGAVTVATLVDLASSDYVTVRIAHNTGGSDVTVDFNAQRSPEFWIHKVS